jgi:hypothetical protein
MRISVQLRGLQPMRNAVYAGSTIYAEAVFRDANFDLVPDGFVTSASWKLIETTTGRQMASGNLTPAPHLHFSIPAALNVMRTIQGSEERVLVVTATAGDGTGNAECEFRVRRLQ